MSENLTAEELADLKAKALKATPGDWLHHDTDGLQIVAFGGGIQPYIAKAIGPFSDGKRRANAAFIAAANPAVVLRLLTDLEEAEGRLDEAELFDAESDAAFKDLDAQIEALTARAEKAEGDRDALRAAIGFLPGPLKENRDEDIVIIDAKALRPAMVQARRQRDEAQGRNAENHAFAAEEIRAWVKERFGKWITHKTAWTLANRIFGSERTLSPSNSEADGNA